MIERITRVRCDLCNTAGPRAIDDLSACHHARQAGWRMISFDFYGNEGHICRTCAAGKTDEQLLAAIMAKADAPA